MEMPCAVNRPRRDPLPGGSRLDQPPEREGGQGLGQVLPWTDLAPLLLGGRWLQFCCIDDHTKDWKKGLQVGESGGKSSKTPSLVASGPPIVNCRQYEHHGQTTAQGPFVLDRGARSPVNSATRLGVVAGEWPLKGQFPQSKL